MRPSTSMARPSFVHSSVTVRHFNGWPLAHQSKTKSYDHTWFAPVGSLGRGRPVAIRLRGRFAGNLQLRPLPRTMCPARAHRVTVTAKEDRDAPVAVAGILR